MNGLQLTPEEYVTEIIMSQDRFLLLEGADDEDFFTIILLLIQQWESHLQPLLLIRLPLKQILWVVINYTNLRFF